jgi:hypothetical protein
MPRIQLDPDSRGWILSRTLTIIYVDPAVSVDHRLASDRMILAPIAFISRERVHRNPDSQPGGASNRFPLPLARNRLRKRSTSPDLVDALAR